MVNGLVDARLTPTSLKAQCFKNVEAYFISGFGFMFGFIRQDSLFLSILIFIESIFHKSGSRGGPCL